VPYKRIHLIGGPGSGKSYVAARISATFGITSYALDDLFWDSAAATYGVRADPGERDQAFADIVAQDAWVIEGAYYKWLTPGFERADLIIILNPPVWLRDWRIVKRSALQLLGMAPTNRKETIASIFTLLRWNHTYERTQLLPARVLLAGMKKSPVECRTLSHIFAVLAEGSPIPHVRNRL
jgi:adenylate kinase family enzyme